MTLAYWHSRWKAAGIHFSLSVVLVSLVFVGLIALWYPPELWRMAKVGGLVMILASVDVTLGPLLTLAVFKHGKRGMKFDLAVIALLQIAGLVYGLHVMFQSRPVFLPRASACRMPRHGRSRPFANAAARSSPTTCPACGISMAKDAPRVACWMICSA